MSTESCCRQCIWAAQAWKRAEPAGFARQASPQDLDIRRELAQAQMRGWTEQPHGWRAYSGGHMEEATVVAYHSAGGGSPGSRLP